jgi:hypothetical protein
MLARSLYSYIKHLIPGIMGIGRCFDLDYGHDSYGNVENFK